MASALVWYFLGGTVLFFFWAYGIASFALDMKNKVLPGLAALWRNRKRRAEDAEAEREREEKREQLY